MYMTTHDHTHYNDGADTQQWMSAYKQLHLITCLFPVIITMLHGIVILTLFTIAIAVSPWVAIALLIGQIHLSETQRCLVAYSNFVHWIALYLRLALLIWHHKLPTIVKVSNGAQWKYKNDVGCRFDSCLSYSLLMTEVVFQVLWSGKSCNSKWSPLPACIRGIFYWKLSTPCCQGFLWRYCIGTRT